MGPEIFHFPLKSVEDVVSWSLSKTVNQLVCSCTDAGGSYKDFMTLTVPGHPLYFGCLYLFP